MFIVLLHMFLSGVNVVMSAVQMHGVVLVLRENGVVRAVWCSKCLPDRVGAVSVAYVVHVLI